MICSPGGRCVTYYLQVDQLYRLTAVKSAQCSCKGCVMSVRQRSLCDSVSCRQVKYMTSGWRANVVALRQARLVVGWVTVPVCSELQAYRPTQVFCTPWDEEPNLAKYQSCRHVQHSLLTKMLSLVVIKMILEVIVTNDRKLLTIAIAYALLVSSPSVWLLCLANNLPHTVDIQVYCYNLSVLCYL